MRGTIELSRTPDPLRSDAANAMVLNNEKRALTALKAKVTAEVLSAVASDRAALDRKRVTRAGLVPDQFAQEIRAVVRALPLADRLHFMTQAIARNDASAVAAVTSAPALLSGLTDQQVAQFREAYLDRTSPSHSDELSELVSVIDN